MSSYIVKDTELTSVANAIRTKGGTNASLTFPNGFVSAIGNISGGGSSDFSTAQVTFVCNAENEVLCILAMAEEASPPFEPNPQTHTSISLFEGDENTVTAVLYKGTNCCFFRGATQVSGTGDVSVLNAMQAYITGDCTITIS